MQNRLSLHLILRQIWLTPTVRTNRPTAKNTCQWSDHSCIGTWESTRHCLQRYCSQPIQCATNRDACNGCQESFTIPQVYIGIPNSLPRAPILLAIGYALYQHYRIYQLGLGRKPYNSQVGRRMCVRPGTDWRQRRTHHVQTDSLASQVSERHSAFNT